MRALVVDANGKRWEVEATRAPDGSIAFAAPFGGVVASVRLIEDDVAPAAELAATGGGGRPHLIDGEFQSDKYPTCPRGKVPLSCKDPTAQDLLWEYAQRRRAVDAEFADDLEEALRLQGFEAPEAARASMGVNWHACYRRLYRDVAEVIGSDPGTGSELGGELGHHVGRLTRERDSLAEQLQAALADRDALPSPSVALEGTVAGAIARQRMRGVLEEWDRTSDEGKQRSARAAELDAERDRLDEIVRAHGAVTDQAQELADRLCGHAPTSPPIWNLTRIGVCLGAAAGRLGELESMLGITLSTPADGDPPESFAERLNRVLLVLAGRNRAERAQAATLARWKRRAKRAEASAVPAPVDRGHLRTTWIAPRLADLVGRGAAAPLKPGERVRLSALGLADPKLRRHRSGVFMGATPRDPNEVAVLRDGCKTSIVTRAELWERDDQPRPRTASKHSPPSGASGRRGSTRTRQSAPAGRKGGR